MSTNLERLVSPSLGAEIRRVKLRTRRDISADLIGQYRSSFRGSGLSFQELREYSPGDDIKHIHWKATARSSNSSVFIKSYEEDRQLNILLVLDESRSTLFGAENTKHQRALEFCALIALLAKNSGDAVGLCTFSNDIHNYLPPSKKKSQFEKLISLLLQDSTLKSSTDLTRSLSSLSQRRLRRSIIFIISDFYCADFSESLKTLALKHDVVCVLLENKLDRSLPKVGITEFHDAESGKRLLVDLSYPKTTAWLEEQHKKHYQNVRSIALNSGGDFMSIDNSPVHSLIRLMHERRAKFR